MDARERSYLGHNGMVTCIPASAAASKDPALVILIADEAVLRIRVGRVWGIEMSSCSWSASEPASRGSRSMRIKSSTKEGGSKA